MNSFRLQSNPTEAVAYSQLNKTQALLNKNIQRLSSGMRINSADDDTAGSAMATRMTNQIRGMHQANQNSRDANNLLATAEAGLNDISDLLAQMRELSVQAATDTLNDTDRASIDLEFQSLKDELTRIANMTEHNGMNVLNGTYQAGGTYNQDHIAGATLENQLGVWRIQIGADNDADSQHEFSIMNATANGLDLNINRSATNLAEFTAAIKNQEIEVYVDKTTGEFAHRDDSDSNIAKLTVVGSDLKADGTTITNVGLNSSGKWVVSNDSGGTGTAKSDSTLGDVATAKGLEDTNGPDFGWNAYDANVRDVSAAREAVTHLDRAVDEINRERSYVGSEQNKLQFTMSNLSSNIQSIESARSSIEDVDFVAEAADLAKNQILAQSGTAMLAQASAISQNILSLIAA